MIDNNMYNNYDVTLHKWINLSLIMFTTHVVSASHNFTMSNDSHVIQCYKILSCWQKYYAVL